MRSSASALFSFDLNPSLIGDKQFSNQRIVVEVENNRFQCHQKLLSLTVHTKETFAKKVVNNDKNKIKNILFEELSSVVPISLPAPIYEAGHRWLYGFTATSLDKSHLYYEKKNLGICGDWCLGDTILHAASSGIKLAEQILAS
jgi:predicted NAD/FAD-dependent oxidoreductase